MDTLCRLMPPDLPSTIDPERLSRKGESVSGEYAIKDMDRLADLLFDTTGMVSFKLVFSVDENLKLPVITGELTANIQLVCQRCLDEVSHLVQREIKLVVIDDESQQVNIPVEFEFIEKNGSSQINLQDLIEDELILAIPITKMHDEKVCKASKLVKSINESGKVSPFAVLKDISNKQ